MTGSGFPLRSFFALVMLALLAIALPLALGLAGAIRVLQGLADSQTRFAEASLAITRDSRQLTEAIAQLQRTAGQYHLLMDAELASRVRTRSEALAARVEALSRRLADDPASRAHLDALAAAHARLARQLLPGGFLDAARFRALDPEFDALHKRAQALTQSADDWVRRESRRLEEDARRTERRLALLVFALFPLTLLLAGILALIIHRPIRQLRAAIQQLGQGDLAPLPPVSGPRDISALGQALDWLRQRLAVLDQEQTRFLRQVSHDLKTPLASLREGVSLLQGPLSGGLDASQQEVVAIMEHSTADLDARIEALMQAARQRTAACVPEETDLCARLAALIQRHRLASAKRGLEWDCVCTGLTLVTDTTRLDAILDNLLSNAVKYSPQGGRVRIEAGAREGLLTLTVCDQGAGVAEADRERIFEPFFQGLPPAGGTPVKGTGLGLAIAREAALRLGGTLVLGSAPPGWSTCFLLTLPLYLKPDED